MSVQADILTTICRRGRTRNDLGDFQMSQLLSENDRSDLDRAGIFEGAQFPTNLSSIPDVNIPVSTSNERVRVIWGTNIIISDAISSFRSFLANFTLSQRKRFECSSPESPLPNISPSDLNPLYPRLLTQVHIHCLFGCCFIA